MIRLDFRQLGWMFLLLYTKMPCGSALHMARSYFGLHYSPLWAYEMDMALSHLSSRFLIRLRTSYSPMPNYTIVESY